MAALGATAGAVVLFQDNGKAAATRPAATPTASEVTEPEPDPTLVPEVPKESSQPSERVSEAEERTETVPAITSSPSRRTARPSPRPDEDPAGGTEKPTAKPDNSPAQTPGPTTSPQPSAPSKPSPSPTPTAKPTAKPTTEPPRRPNPHTATGVCGGYKVINSRALGNAATVYLLYNAAQGKNCVVTMARYVTSSKVAMNAILQVKGGSAASDPGKFTAYAGPVRLPAGKKCVIWGGSYGSRSWKSGWSHCG